VSANPTLWPGDLGQTRKVRAYVRVPTSLEGKIHTFDSMQIAAVEVRGAEIKKGGTLSIPSSSYALTLASSYKME